MSHIRWGLLCTANINRRVIPAIQESKRGELVAVASRSIEKAEKYAKHWEIPQAFGSYQELLDSGRSTQFTSAFPIICTQNGASKPCKLACMCSARNLLRLGLKM